MRRDNNYKKIISGKKVYLRYLEKTDVNDTYLEMINDAETVKFLDNPSKKTKAQLLKYFNQIKKNKNFHFFAIIEKKTNEYVGNAKIGPIIQIHKRTGFGRLIHKKFHNKGYGSEVTTLLIKFIFEKLKLQRIILGNRVKNISSYKSNLKAGLESEAILKKYDYSNGKYEDVYLVGLSRERYLIKKRKRKI
jgi:RimJ/RimL family protein N-acetyltransferase